MSNEQEAAARVAQKLTGIQPGDRVRYNGAPPLNRHTGTVVAAGMVLATIRFDNGWETFLRIDALELLPEPPT